MKVTDLEFSEEHGLIINLEDGSKKILATVYNDEVSKATAGRIRWINENSANESNVKIINQGTVFEYFSK